MFVGRAHEGHDAVARRPVDGDARLHQRLAGGVDVVHFVGQVPEIARLAIVLAVPVVGEFHLRPRAAVLLAPLDQFRVACWGREHQRIAVLLVHPPAGLLESELVAIEIERGIEIAYAEHGVQISHGSNLMNDGRPPGPPDYIIMIAPDLETAILRLRDLIEAARTIVPFTGAGISTECGIPDFRSPGGLWTKNQPIPFDAFMGSREMRNEAWRRRFVMQESFNQAKPGRGH